MKSWPRTPLSLRQTKRTFSIPSIWRSFKKRISSNLVGKKNIILASSQNLASPSCPIHQNPYLGTHKFTPHAIIQAIHITWHFHFRPVLRIQMARWPSWWTKGPRKPRLEVRITWENLTRRYKKIKPPTWITKYIQTIHWLSKCVSPHMYFPISHIQSKWKNRGLEIK